MTSFFTSGIAFLSSSFTSGIAFLSSSFTLGISFFASSFTLGISFFASSCFSGIMDGLLVSPSLVSLNFDTKLFKRLACLESSSEAAADSSAVAELFCTVAEICSIPALIWDTPFASSSDAAEISRIKLFICTVCCETVPRDSAVSSVILAPFSTARMVSSIRVAVFCAAFADFCARFPTSSATTAKPFPAAPALAASIAAFKDRILV